MDGHFHRTVGPHFPYWAQSVTELPHHARDGRAGTGANRPPRALVVAARRRRSVHRRRRVSWGRGISCRPPAPARSPAAVKCLPSAGRLARPLSRCRTPWRRPTLAAGIRMQIPAHASSHAAAHVPGWVPRPSLAWKISENRSWPDCSRRSPTSASAAPNSDCVPALPRPKGGTASARARKSAQVGAAPMGPEYSAWPAATRHATPETATAGTGPAAADEHFRAGGCRPQGGLRPRLLLRAPSSTGGCGPACRLRAP